MEQDERDVNLTEEESSVDRVEIPLEEGELFEFAGVHDRNLKVLRVCLKAKITATSESVILSGALNSVAEAKGIVEELLTVLRRRGKITGEDVETVLNLMSDREQLDKREIPSTFSIIETPQKQISLRSANQERYYRASREHDIVFAIGPAGTGKTYLAVAMAVNALTEHEVKRIILVRPAVEAGENLGFLPGDIKEKVDPYFRPLYDALMEMMQIERVKRYIERNVIEIAPLAFMRGRTLSDAFVILDEAQNTTADQMMMFLTRLGARSKALITGDTTQIDLVRKEDSGLLQAPKVLNSIPGISFVLLTEKDAVRHELVHQIITAYNEYHNSTNTEP